MLRQCVLLGNRKVVVAERQTATAALLTNFANRTLPEVGSWGPADKAAFWLESQMRRLARLRGVV